MIYKHHSPAPFLIAGAALCIILAGWAWLAYSNLPTGAEGCVIVEITPGMTAGRIALMLKEKGLIRSVLYFKLISEANGFSRIFKAGRHAVSGAMSAQEIAYLLTMCPQRPPDLKVTVREGLTIHETASVLAAEAGMDSAEFVRLSTDAGLAQELGLQCVTMEGYLFPDTYYVKKGAQPLWFVERMVKQFHDVFDDSLKARARELGMTVHEAVTLASIIETEARLDSERPLVSSVFHRRLAIGLPLEANPTIQYSLGTKKRVRKEDLAVESPYNTYTHRGLPPGPIASPGRKSIMAALYPAETKYLYFMADGRGGHVFSRTLNEHIAAVHQYRKLRRLMKSD